MKNRVLILNILSNEYSAAGRKLGAMVAINAVRGDTHIRLTAVNVSQKDSCIWWLVSRTDGKLWCEKIDKTYGHSTVINGMHETVEFIFFVSDNKRILPLAYGDTMENKTPTQTFLKHATARINEEISPASNEKKDDAPVPVSSAVNEERLSPLQTTQLETEGVAVAASLPIEETAEIYLPNKATELETQTVSAISESAEDSQAVSKINETTGNAQTISSMSEATGNAQTVLISADKKEDLQTTSEIADKKKIVAVSAEISKEPQTTVVPIDKEAETQTTVASSHSKEEPTTLTYRQTVAAGDESEPREATSSLGAESIPVAETEISAKISEDASPVISMNAEPSSNEGKVKSSRDSSNKKAVDISAEMIAEVFKTQIESIFEAVEAELEAESVKVKKAILAEKITDKSTYADLSDEKNDDARTVHSANIDKVAISESRAENAAQDRKYFGRTKEIYFTDDPDAEINARLRSENIVTKKPDDWRTPGTVNPDEELDNLINFREKNAPVNNVPPPANPHTAYKIPAPPIPGSKSVRLLDEPDEYDGYIAGTGNYYREEVSEADIVELISNRREDKDSVSVFYDKIDAAVNAKEGGKYYDRIKKQLHELFARYEPYEPLIKQIRESYWVKIGYGDSYYIIGLVLKDLIPLYVCYALSSDTVSMPDDSYFYLHGNPSHYILCQCAETGRIVRPEFSLNK